MSIFDRTKHDPDGTAGEERFDKFAALVEAAEALVQQALDLVEADTQAARRYNRDVVGPWRERAAQAEENLKRLTLLHASEVRAARELVERGEFALAAEAHGGLLRQLRDAWQKIEAVRQGAPEGMTGISKDALGWWQHHAAVRISPAAERVLMEILPVRPATTGTSASDDARARINDYVRHELSELRVAGSFTWAHPGVAPLLDKEPATV